MSVQILIGDCRVRMAELADASVDSVVCDPPYHLTSIVKRFGSKSAAPAKSGKTGAYARASRGFMGQTWDGGDVAFDPETWAEVLRVLKPGGHLVAFSGTRTYHRMAVAIEDAGFEIRDQLAWVYGSGFPKSLDVSKAIDKGAGAEREVVGTVKQRDIRNGNGRGHGEGIQKAQRGDGPVQYLDHPITAPATEAAQQWQGWGTALKPAWEPICLARKPLGEVGINVLNVVENALRERGVTGEIKWKEEAANVVASISSRTSSCSTDQRAMAAISAESADASETMSGEHPDEKSSQPTTRHGATPAEPTLTITTEPAETSCAPQSSTPTVESAPVVAKASGRSSRSITLTEEAESTEKRSTEKSSTSCTGSDFRQDIECFVGIVTGLSGSMATARIIRTSDGTFIWPKNLPRYAQGRPLSVAQNVLTHGTGALNIDGCRIEGTKPQVTQGINSNASSFNVAKERRLSGDPNEGRWPANLCHDGSEEVLAGFPETESGVMKGGTRRAAQDGPGSVCYGTYGGNATNADTFGDSGSAARFFLEAKYSEDELLFCRAKAMLSAWSQELANSAEGSSSLSNQHADFALRLAATLALPVGRRLSALTGLSTSATPSELNSLATNFIAVILSLESGCLPAWLQGKPTPSSGPAPCAEIPRPTDTITITISHWKSSGCAEPVTFSITPKNSELGVKGLSEPKRFQYAAKATTEERGEGNNHPTVKPTALMQWLCRLVTPKGGTILDPFSGSGSTLIAADAEQFNAIGCELSPEYAAIAEKRVREAAGMFADVSVSPAQSEAA